MNNNNNDNDNINNSNDYFLSLCALKIMPIYFEQTSKKKKKTSNFRFMVQPKSACLPWLICITKMSDCSANQPAYFFMI